MPRRPARLGAGRFGHSRQGDQFLVISQKRKMKAGSNVSSTPSTPSRTPATWSPSQIGMFGASSAEISWIRSNAFWRTASSVDAFSSASSFCISGLS